MERSRLFLHSPSFLYLCPNCLPGQLICAFYAQLWFPPILWFQTNVVLIEAFQNNFRIQWSPDYPTLPFYLTLASPPTQWEGSPVLLSCLPPPLPISAKSLGGTHWEAHKLCSPQHGFFPPLLHRMFGDIWGGKKLCWGGRHGVTAIVYALPLASRDKGKATGLQKPSERHLYTCTVYSTILVIPIAALSFWCIFILSNIC